MDAFEGDQETAFLIIWVDTKTTNIHWSNDIQPSFMKYPHCEQKCTISTIYVSYISIFQSSSDSLYYKSCIRCLYWTYFQFQPPNLQYSIEFSVCCDRFVMHTDFGTATTTCVDIVLQDDLKHVSGCIFGIRQTVAMTLATITSEFI